MMRSLRSFELASQNHRIRKVVELARLELEKELARQRYTRKKALKKLP